MIQPDVDRIFSVADDKEFRHEALALFRFQAERCEPYRQYLDLIGVAADEVCEVEQIPFLPIGLFKTHNIYCGEGQPEQIFTSSSTGGGVPSRHAMADLTIYERAFRGAFRHFYGDASDWSIYGLLPSYLERKGSSLIYMVDRLIADAGGHGGFYLNDYERLIADIKADPRPKILLGVTYALLDLAEQFAPDLHDVVVMETGGMKGHREELPKEELHRILCNAFNVNAIHSEYGMAELTSQAYSRGGNRFFAPPWMRIITRDLNDPFRLLPTGQRGGINIIDLGNVYSCAFIQTEDAGRVFADGSFEIAGRIDHSEIRGCNLLVQ
mgnify:FL=1